jgi:hypothetical protein
LESKGLSCEGLGFNSFGAYHHQFFLLLWLLPCPIETWYITFTLFVNRSDNCQHLHDKRDVIGALWDKAWRESEDTENVYYYVDRMRLMRVEDIHLCRGRLREYLIR